MPDLPNGTVTFLLSDIEGSTRLWEQHPDAMRLALARHDAIADVVIEQHAGTLVKSRGEGDSLIAVFARAIDAVAAAFSLQRSLMSETWPAQTPLRARMALHTGGKVSWSFLGLRPQARLTDSCPAAETAELEEKVEQSWAAAAHSRSYSCWCCSAPPRPLHLAPQPRSQTRCARSPSVPAA